MKAIARFGLATALFLAPLTVRAADHGDAPGTRVDNRLDINDVYVFQSPENPANTVLILTTHPAAGILTLSPYRGDEAVYQFLVDNNDDLRPDVRLNFTFKKPDSAGKQAFTVTRAGDGEDGELLAKGSTGTVTAVNGGGKVTAGLFDDPFFFDLIAFRMGLSFSPTAATNFFRGLNVNAIVLEVPSSTLTGGGDSTISVWGATRVDDKQFDRMGNPAINTVLVSGSANKDAFNKAQPINDFANFSGGAIAILKKLGNGQTRAEALATVLFPDVIRFDTSSASGFLNGRKLTDDVIDAELNLLSNGAVTSDFVANDSTFRATFPYLGIANP